ncbi:MAG: NAD(P)H-binding protein [Gammaproteobacteria bacterium]
MNHPPVAMIAGATGAVGSRLLDRLLSRQDDTRVIAVGRRAPRRPHARLQWIAAELAEMPAILAGQRCTEAFCCLGTTRRTAGSRSAFRAVDLDGVLNFAQAARAAGAEFFGMVSAAGANPSARAFYLRTKGEAEAAVAALDFASLAIMQPGLLRGDREEFRALERLGQVAAPLVDQLLQGKLARYRSVAADDVAAALDHAARNRPAGVHRFDPASIETLAGER